MAYIKLNDKGETSIYEERTDSFVKAPLGELLFDFLELDFSEYNDLYQRVGPSYDIEKSDLFELIKKYPKTSEKHNYLLKNIDDLDPEELDDLRDYTTIYLYDNQDLFDNIYNHPFCKLSDTMLEGTLVDFDLSYYDANLYELQECMRELINFCFLNTSNTSHINDLTPSERYFYFCSRSKQRYKYITKLHSTILFTPIDLFYELSESLTDSNLSDVSIQNKIKGIASIPTVNECSTVRDFIYWEFYTILSQNTIIKRCINCNKLFIPKGNYNTDCCDRIPKGERFTCKKIVAMETRKSKLQNNPILKEYEKAYKRMFARVSNKKMSRDEFLIWSNDAATKREAFSQLYKKNPSESVLKDFKDFLGNK